MNYVMTSRTLNYQTIVPECLTKSQIDCLGMYIRNFYELLQYLQFLNGWNELHLNYEYVFASIFI